MNSKEYGQGKRASGGPGKYDEKRSPKRRYAGKRFDSDEGDKSADSSGSARSSGTGRGGRSAGTGSSGRSASTGSSGKRFDTGSSGRSTGTGGSGKRFGTGRGVRSVDTGSTGKRFDTGSGGSSGDAGSSGERYSTSRSSRSTDTGFSGKRDDRPVKRWSDKPSYGDKTFRPSGDHRPNDAVRSPGFKPRRKNSYGEEAHAVRPVERTGYPDAEDREDRIEGRNPVLEALRSDRPLNKVFIEKDNPDATLLKIIAMAREKSIPIQYVDRRKLDTMSTTRIHQGVILEAAAHEYVEISDILKIAADKDEDPFVVILDGITDINNFGSIIRSAECAGVHGIIIPKRRSATLNATVVKVAAGAQEYVAIARVANLTQAIRELKDKGIWITAADLDGDRPYYESDLKGPVALVIGSEGEGISKVVKDECDYLVKIPMKGKISSLNAGVAAGLIMFEISKKRG